MNFRKLGWVLLFLGLSTPLFAQEILTNETRFSNAPSWLTPRAVEKAVAKVQRIMEWDIRRVNVRFHSDAQAFQALHGFGPTVRAVTYVDKNQIELGPPVNSSNFEFIFGHELVHVILWQKYKAAIPKWLDEGLANYVPGKDLNIVDYSWLANQAFPDVRDLVHPFQATPSRKSPPVSSRYHYQASTALIELIASKCSLRDLLQLSVGEKLESYLSTYCRIPDINESFKSWVKTKGTQRNARR